MITNKIHISSIIDARRMDPIYFRYGTERFGLNYPLATIGSISYDIQSGFGAGKGDQATQEDGILHLRPTNINNEGVLIFDKNVYVPSSLNKPILVKGDVLFNNTNSQELVGKTAMYDSDKAIFFSNHITRIRVNKELVIAEYLWIILNKYQRNKIFFSICTNWNNQSGVGMELLKSIKIPLPSMQTQKKIVEIYTKAQSQKQTRNTRAKRLLEYASSYFLKELGISIPKTMEQKRSFKVNISDLIGKRLNPYSHNSNALQLTKLIASNNNAKTVLSQLITNSIAGDWGIDDYEEIDDNYTKCLVLRATEFDNKYNLNIDNGRTKYRMIRNSKLNKMSIQDGDILIEKSGGSIDQPVGRVAYIDDNILKGRDICYSNFIHKITIDSKLINPKYVYYYLSTMYSCGLTESIQSQTNGIRNLIMGDYLNTFILLPLEKKQTEIVNKIDRIYRLAKMCDNDAIEVLETAKQKIETMILG